MNSTSSLDMPSHLGNLITEHFEESLCIVDRQWRVTYLSNFAKKALGASGTNLMGNVLWDALPGSIETPLGQFCLRAMHTETMSRFEGFLVYARGWYDVRVYPIEEGLLIYFQDITEHKQLEDQLRESEARFRELSNASHEGVISFQNEIIVDANQNVLTMYGYHSLDELVGQPVTKLFAPESLPEIQKHIDQNLTESYEVIGIRKDGTRFPVERSGKSVEYHGRPARIITLRDLTAQQQHEQTLRENEERYRILSEAAFEGLLLHDNGRIILANETFSRMSGYSVEELADKSVFDLLTPQSQVDLQERLASKPAEGAAIREAVRKDGSTYFMEARSKLLTYQGRTVRLVAVRDITEIRQAEEALKRTQAQLLQSQKLESVGRLAGGIAHDFNNLLTAISGYSELALLEVAEDTPLHDDLKEVIVASERATALIRQLLIFSRQQVMQSMPLSLNTIVSEMDRLLRRLLGENIDLTCLLTDGLWEVNADPHQLEQVIMNLAVNARDAMGEGGRLTIETANVELDEIYRSAGHPQIKTGSYVMVAVSDTGTGMDEATQQKIFEPFFTTKPVGKGTGLGLSTVYGIVEQAGGYVWVYSEVGKGTTFKVYLPKIDALPFISDGQINMVASAVSQSELSATKVPPITNYNILVVEDDMLVRELIDKVLIGAGHQVLLAPNGQRALNMLNDLAAEAAGLAENNGAENKAQTKIDLVVTDIVMPSMGGRELIAQLKQTWPTLRVLCISGYTEKVIEQHEFLKECDSFLQKPFTPRILLQKIQEVMQTAP